MVSDVLTLTGLVQQAPALVVAILAMLFGGWTYRQSRRAIAAAEARLGVSNVRQGKRLGALERVTTLLDMRRRITEEELEDRGIRLSPWPPDGPRSYPRGDDVDDVDDQVADLDTAHLETLYFRPPPPASRRTS